MEEKKPLDSRLTHTSKEPEAQLWAQIGTSSYDPTAKPPKEESPVKKTPSKENGKSDETPQAKADVGNQDVQYFIDTGTESAKSEDVDQIDEKDVDQKEKEKPKDLSKTKSFTLGDGFTESDANAKESKDSEGRSRSRSRSRSRERRHGGSSKLYPDYATNSNNPNDVKARVFVGHLNTEKCTKEEVAKLFEPFGDVVGVNLRDGYGFVQYKNEAAVKDAIKNVHATNFHDMKLASKREEKRDLIDELAYLRRRELDRHRHPHYDDYMYDRSRMGPVPRPPPFYGDYMDREDRYHGEGIYGRYGDGPRFDDRYHDDPYRGGDRYRADRYRDPGRYRDDPYDYSYNQRGGSYADQYASRRM